MNTTTPRPFLPESALLIKELKPQLSAWRRHLHQHPELSFEEFETAAFLAQELKTMGYQVTERVGGTGVVGLLDTGRPGPVTAFRAEMDALPLLEDTGLPFESAKSGIMHACGHDAHMAIVLGTAKVFSQLKHHLRGVIKIFFQPGEEANGGALCMINGGVLTDPPVGAIFALHVNPVYETGVIGLKSGYLTATDDGVLIQIHGVSTHSSAPEEGVNAITIAGNVLSALQAVQASGLSPYDIATFSICKIKGGDAPNVIPDYVEMEGMLRCIHKETKAAMRQRITTICQHTAEALGGRAVVEFIDGFPAVNNDPALTDLVVRASHNVLARTADLVQLTKPHLGSEDFSYYQEEIPGVIFMLGCSEPGTSGALHTTTLLVDEEALTVGVEMFAAVAAEICEA